MPQDRKSTTSTARERLAKYVLSLTILGPLRRESYRWRNTRASSNGAADFQDEIERFMIQAVPIAVLIALSAHSGAPESAAAEENIITCTIQNRVGPPMTFRITDNSGYISCAKKKGVASKGMTKKANSDADALDVKDSTHPILENEKNFRAKSVNNVVIPTH
jgi:hypothetical protein